MREWRPKAETDKGKQDFAEQAKKLKEILGAIKGHRLFSWLGQMVKKFGEACC